LQWTAVQSPALDFLYAAHEGNITKMVTVGAHLAGFPDAS
jgi:hypothetical protein